MKNRVGSLDEFCTVDDNNRSLILYMYACLRPTKNTRLGVVWSMTRFIQLVVDY